ncbi:transaldolase [Campylobacter ureolyticus]|uniref:Transaldolase n=1 Tax=Campylobacter ureolyticus TaxID=827 RepID=A0A9Q4KKM8_9BACT|nr:transaldolase [Campylobacter ureolyticus]MCZ6159359.1 transaldolase [Campylobacter ureolyticus]MCZ6162649.1 transaldolase [Campylobacter ureolyticus]MCZ6164858.1 transaldolase [Campylobacter ureolyticus]
MYDGNFSLWCDFIERDFISGEFKELLKNGVFNGATSNPSIFKSAILSSPAYKDQISNFSHKNPKEIYEILATSDIRLAAEAMLKNYVEKDDGFISLEVDPTLSCSAKETYKEGKRLYASIGMPNVMIKVPATDEGFEAMSDLLSKGINVNATLIFSPNQTKNCLEAFKNGTKKFKKRFPGATLPKTVISIFVSRFDRLMDEKFATLNIPTAKLGIYNATKCYYEVQNSGLSNVRALFASTGVKGDSLRPSYYVDELMFENSVNTAPLNTIKEFLKGEKKVIKPVSDEIINEFFDLLKQKEIDIKEIYKELLEDGLKQFEVAFDEILKNLKGE